MRAGIVVNVMPGDRRRLEAIVGDRNAPQKHVCRAKIILATADGCGHGRDHAAIGKAKPVVWRWQARFMAGGRCKPDARQDAQTRQATAPCNHRPAGGRFGAVAAAGRSNPLDRPNAGEGGRRELAIGAAHPWGSPTRPASHPDVQVVERPDVRGETQGLLASTSTRPPMPSFSRSTKRAKSRHSTAASQDCR
jgi:hypothetical protein